MQELPVIDEHKRYERVAARERTPSSTMVPNTIFVICMLGLIVFFFWQYAVRDTAPVDMSENSRTAPVSAPSTSPN